jgi:hypothetical protein
MLDFRNYPGAVNDNGYTYKQALKSIGKGWRELIRTAFYFKPASVRIIQVKEKFGTLTIYIAGDYNTKEFEEYSRLIYALEAQSSKICEWCGKLGDQDNKYHWILTLCESCKTKRDEEKANENL